MGVDETSDTPMEVNNTQDSSVERTERGAVQCKRITKMREGELLNVQYNEDGQRIGEGGKDLASYSIYELVAIRPANARVNSREAKCLRRVRKRYPNT
ncbi:hypothetical protein IFM89_008298 [Coptis chinensis]|uniref:Uncharacterized protein n=1 Tax=Coptis chinensis TaxID=261450 RepID=A0A835M7E6_9MAGN|nr:hypothetical protein IFM89_008298 [Coptis chinensis]